MLHYLRRHGRSLAASASVAVCAFSFNAQAQDKPPTPPTLDESATVLASIAAQRCDPQFDGKPEVESRVRKLVNSWNSIAATQPGQFPPDMPLHAAAWAARHGVALCDDTRLNGLSISENAGAKFDPPLQPTAALHVNTGTISLNPGTPEAERSSTSLLALVSMAGLQRQLSQAQMAKFMAAMNDDVETAMKIEATQMTILQTPLALVPDKAAPGTARLLSAPSFSNAMMGAPVRP